MGAVVGFVEPPRGSTVTSTRPPSPPACPAPVRRLGVPDSFGHSGTACEVLKDFGLTAENIANVIQDFMKVKTE